MNPVDLSRLDALAGWMRANGAVRVVVDGDRVEMELGVAPVVAAEAPAPPTAEDYLQMKKQADEAYDKTLFGVVEGRLG
jgi:hypothetical protein